MNGGGPLLMQRDALAYAVGLTRVDIAALKSRLSAEQLPLAAAVLTLAIRDLITDMQHVAAMSPFPSVRQMAADWAVRLHVESDQASYQARVASWLLACFGRAIAEDQQERNCRFLEEALELVQALGLTREDALQLVDYTYGRPAGAPAQEVGGVMVTLAALCCAAGIPVDEAAEMELARIVQPHVMKKIRAKQAAKPKASPLPA